MAAQWHYELDGKSHGPISLEQLQAWVDEERILPRDMVWKAGTPDWVPARSVAELEFQAPRRRRRRGREIGSDEFKNSELRSIALAQRVLLFVILAAMIFYGIAVFTFGVVADARGGRQSPVIQLAIGSIGIVIIIAQAAAIVWLMIAMKKGMWLILFIPLMLIPCVNLISLLIINSMATSALQRAGVKVGFMGASASSIPDDPE